MYTPQEEYTKCIKIKNLCIKLVKNTIVILRYTVKKYKNVRTLIDISPRLQRLWKATKYLYRVIPWFHRNFKQTFRW